MNVETEKETIGVNRVVSQKNETVFVDGDAIIPDAKPDIISSIHTNGTVCLYKKELLDGKVRIDGSIACYMIYVAEGEREEIRGLNTSLDFTQVIDMPEVESGMDLDLEVRLKNIECKILNGRKVNMKAGLEIEACVYANQEIAVVKEIKTKTKVQMLEQKIPISSLVGRGETKAYAKETLVIDQIDKFAEILNVEVKLSHQDQKVSYRKVLAKADVNITILYLTEDGRINSIQGTIPVMGFIDIQEVMETNLCDVKYMIKNMIIKPNEAEEHSIYVEAEVEMSCCAYETKEIKLIKDVYSPECDLTFSQKQVKTMSEMQKIVHNYHMTKQIASNELMGKKLFQIEARNTLNRVSITNEIALYEGEILLDVLFMAEGSNRMENKCYHVPYEYKEKAMGVMNQCNCQTQIDMTNENFILMPDGNLEIKLDINFISYVSKMIEVQLINEIKQQDTRSLPSYSMVIYFVKEGDSLWKIAKKFRSTIEDIEAINDLEDPNKILPGQRLLIPRYVPRKIEQTA